MPSNILTVMFTDIEGFTERSSILSREDLNKLLKSHDEIIRPLISQFKGKIIKTIGDSFLVTFKSTANAVLCSILIQNRLQIHNNIAEDNMKLNIRIAMNTGNVEIRDKDIFGPTVNIASRLESETPAGKIYITGNSYLSLNRKELMVKKIKDADFKGVNEKVEIYEVCFDENDPFIKELINNSILFTQPVSLKKEKKKKIPIKKEKNFPVNNNPGFLEKNFLQIILLSFFLIVLAGVSFYYLKTTPEKYYSLINKALAKNNINNAVVYADKLLKEFPEYEKNIDIQKKIISLRIGIYLKENNHPAAKLYLKENLERFKWIDKDKYMKDILYSEVLYLYKKNKIDESKEILKNLIKTYPDIKEFKDKYIVLFKNINKVLEKKEIIKEDKIIDNTKSEIEQEIIQEDENTQKNNETYKDFNFSKNNNTRQNQIERLKKDNELNPYLITKYYFANIKYLSPSDNSLQKNSLYTIQKISLDQNWEELKNILFLDEIYTFNLWSDNSILTADILIDILPIKLEEFCINNIDSDNLSRRYYCFYSLEKMGKLETIDLDSFFKKVINLRDIPNDLRPYIAINKKAIEYYKKNITSINKEDLKICSENIEKLIVDLKFNTKDFFRHQNMEDLESLIKNIKEIIQ